MAEEAFAKEAAEKAEEQRVAAARAEAAQKAEEERLAQAAAAKAAAERKRKRAWLRPRQLRRKRRRIGLLGIPPTRDGV